MELARMKYADILTAFKQARAICAGHFVLDNGLHSDTYIQCAGVLEDPTLTMQLASEVVARMPQDLQVDLVVSSDIGDNSFACVVAKIFDKPTAFSELVDGKTGFRDSFEMPKDARVLIVEDVVASEASVKDISSLVQENGGSVVAVATMIDRGVVANFGVPYFPLLRLETLIWEEADCKMCEKGIPFASR